MEAYASKAGLILSESQTVAKRNLDSTSAMIREILWVPF